MNSRKWWILALGTPIVAVLLIVVFQASRPPSSLRKDRMEKLESGMTRAEAEAIMGMPPGDYTTQSFAKAQRIQMGPHMLAWDTDEAVLVLFFNNEGKLLNQSIFERNPESGWQRVRRWLRL